MFAIRLTFYFMVLTKQGMQFHFFHPRNSLTTINQMEKRISDLIQVVLGMYYGRNLSCSMLDYDLCFFRQIIRTESHSHDLFSTRHDNVFLLIYSLS